MFNYQKLSPAVMMGGVLVLLVALPAVFAPIITGLDPLDMAPLDRLDPPSFAHWFGTDLFGRDVFSRTVYGGQTSLIVGASVAALAVFFGMIIGAFAGYVRWIDAIVMRIMDGLMAIPGLLLAIALVAVSGASMVTVIIAIAIPELPRVVRLVRSIVLSVREEVYVEAAVQLGLPTRVIVWRHVLPNTIPALTVLATFILASAVLSEAALGFLGAGVPPEIPSWGNMIAESRIYLQLSPWTIFFPSLCLTITVLGINILGDGLRDIIDPKLKRSI